MRPAVRALGGQYRKHSRAEKIYHDQPYGVTSDPVSLSNKQLRLTGRSPTCDFLDRTNLVHRVQDGETTYFVMPRTLLRYDAPSRSWNDAADEELTLTDNEARCLTRLNLESEGENIMNLWRELGILRGRILTHTAWSFKQWRRFRYDFVVVTSGARAADFWRSSAESRTLCPCASAALWTLCEHAQYAITWDRGGAVATRTTSKGGRPCKQPAAALPVQSSSSSSASGRLARIPSSCSSASLLEGPLHAKRKDGKTTGGAADEGTRARGARAGPASTGLAASSPAPGGLATGAADCSSPMVAVVNDMSGTYHLYKDGEQTVAPQLPSFAHAGAIFSLEVPCATSLQQDVTAMPVRAEHVACELVERPCPPLHLCASRKLRFASSFDAGASDPEPLARFMDVKDALRQFPLPAPSSELFRCSTCPWQRAPGRIHKVKLARTSDTCQERIM